MRVSVIIATYNGSRYLRKQIESIVGQTRIPDEVLIVDDCSSDNGKTKEIIDFYKKKYSFVKFIQNDTNKGWQRNFMEAAEKSLYDVVFFSDQDDIWAENKIKLMTSVMEKNDIPILVSNYDVIDENDKLLETRKETASLANNEFSNGFMETVRPGCVMAVRKDIITRYAHLWVDKFPHDNFFSLIGLLFEQIVTIDANLIQHRIHSSNNSGKRSFTISKRASIQKVRNEQLKKIMSSNEYGLLNGEKKQILQSYLVWGEERERMLLNKSYIKWLFMLRYGLKYYPTRIAYLGDLLSLGGEYGIYK